ncbi:MAG: hypothetical protein Q4G04_06720 [bacterium]|nr:hypothetical protein [bacterium]
MNENIELVECIYKNAKMGCETITCLLNTIKTKDNKIKQVIEKELKMYEEYVKKSQSLLKKYKAFPKEEPFMAKMGATMGIKCEMMKDNSDARIADMLTKGITMGVVDMTKKIDNYKDIVEKEALRLAKDFLKQQNKEIEALKPYL